MKKLIIFSIILFPTFALAQTPPLFYKCTITEYFEGSMVEEKAFYLKRSFEEHTSASVEFGEVIATVQSTGQFEKHGIAGSIRKRGSDFGGASAITYDSVQTLIVSYRQNKESHYNFRCDKL